MPAITINPKDAEALLYVLGEASIEFDNAGHQISKLVVDEIRNQIREQVKPMVKEPEFGSIVRATLPGWNGELPLWQASPAHGAHYWQSEAGEVEVWSELTDVEVLRVGLGNADEDKLAAAFRDGHNEGLGADLDKAREEAWTEGARELAEQVHVRLRSLLADAISAERKNAYEKAIQAVEEVAP